MTDLADLTGRFWPYVLLVLVGFLPSEIWRLLGLFLARRIDDKSEVFVWVRAVSSALLAGVTAKLLFSPSGALATVPVVARAISAAVGLGGYFLLGRSVVIGVGFAEIALVLSIWLAG